MCSGLMDVVSELQGPELATCLWSLARLGSHSPPPTAAAGGGGTATVHALLLGALTGEGGTAVKMRQCTFSQLADVAWSLAKLQVGSH